MKVAVDDASTRGLLPFSSDGVDTPVMKRKKIAEQRRKGRHDVLTWLNNVQALGLTSSVMLWRTDKQGIELPSHLKNPQPDILLGFHLDRDLHYWFNYVKGSHNTQSQTIDRSIRLRPWRTCGARTSGALQCLSAQLCRFHEGTIL